MIDAAGPLTALVLAGQRDGKVDPLAEAAGVTLKSMSPVAGRAMILHVVEALSRSERVGEIIISINADSGIETLPEIERLIATRRLTVVASRGALVDSVLNALESAQFPVLITTADSVLLTPDAVAEIDSKARAQSSDVAVALARKEAVLAAHPDGQRKFYQFSDGAYSNCNSYWLGDRSALGPVDLFRSGGQFVKHPLRVVGLFGFTGIVEIVRFRFGLGTLEGGFRRLSRRFGLTMRAVVVSDGAIAIDVDSERTKTVAEEVLATSRAPAAAAA